MTCYFEFKVYMTEWSLTVGVLAPTVALRDALAQICPFSEARATTGTVRSVFPTTDALLTLTFRDDEPSGPRTAQVSIRRVRRSDAQIRGIVAHLVPRFGTVRLCVQRQAERLREERVRPDARREMDLDSFLGSDEPVPENSLVGVAVAASGG